MDKVRYPRELALSIAREIHARLLPFCERCKVVGSLRRYRSHVGDIEILFIPKVDVIKDLLNEPERTIDRAGFILDAWIEDGFLKKRPNINGGTAWGKLNRLAVHVGSEIPVDFFATTPENWWNSVVCRTGGKATNLQITMAANKRGWRFNSYGSGFTKLDGSETYQTTSEEDVFRFVRLPYVLPQYRP